MRLVSRIQILHLLRILPIYGTVVLSTGIANAQFDQYTPPGGPQQRPESREDRLKREIANARYHLGPFRIAPEGGIKDIAYVRNLFAEGGEIKADVTGTAGAGLRAYLPTGRKVTWIVRALPEYVWWQKRTDARRLNLSSGIEGVGLFNRLFVGIAASRNEQQRLVTPEVTQLANSRVDEAQATVEVSWTHTFSTFVNARADKLTGLVDELAGTEVGQIALLDRKEKALRGGFRWRPLPGWMFGVGAERTQTDFDRPALDTSNEGTAPVFEMLIDRHRFFLEVDTAARSLKAHGASRFVPFDGVTGNVSAAYRLRSNVEAWTYASRSLIYSLSPSYPYFEDERVGVALGLGAGRLRSRLFAEGGNNRYTPFTAAVASRTDKVTSFGGSLSFSLTRLLSLTAQVTRSRYDADVPGADRSFTAGGISLNVGELGTRF
jgi:hypothetical protein